MNIETIEAQLENYRKGLAQLEQQVLVQRGAVLALEQLLAQAQAQGLGAEAAEDTPPVAS